MGTGRLDAYYNSPDISSQILAHGALTALLCTSKHCSSNQQAQRSTWALRAALAYHDSRITASNYHSAGTLHACYDPLYES